MEKKSNTIAWMALIVGIGSIILGWSAYNRSGEDLEAQIANLSMQAQKDIEAQTALTEARLRLWTVNSRLEINENYDEAADEIKKIRQDTETAIADAGQAVQNTFDDLDQDLEQIENDLRSGSSEAIQNIQNLLESWQQNINNQS